MFFRDCIALALGRFDSCPLVSLPRPPTSCSTSLQLLLKTFNAEWSLHIRGTLKIVNYSFVFFLQLSSLACCLLQFSSTVSGGEEGWKKNDIDWLNKCTYITIIWYAHPSSAATRRTWRYPNVSVSFWHPSEWSWVRLLWMPQFEVVVFHIQVTRRKSKVCFPEKPSMF